MVTTRGAFSTLMKAKSRAVNEDSFTPCSSNVTSLSPVDSNFGLMFSSRVSFTINSVRVWFISRVSFKITSVPLCTEVRKGGRKSPLIFQQNETFSGGNFLFLIFKDATNILVWSRLNFIGVLGCVFVSWIETSIESIEFPELPKMKKEREVKIEIQNYA